jgi:hypothetical protein
MRLGPYRSSIALLGMACLVLLLAAGARLFAIWGPATNDSTLVIPIFPGHTLAINVWLRDSVATFWPEATGSAMRDGTRMIKNPGSLTVVLWFNDRIAASTTRLAILKIPAWPLILLSAGLAVGAYWLRPPRSARGPASVVSKYVGTKYSPER